MGGSLTFDSVEGLARGAVERGAQLDRILSLELPAVSRYPQRICGAMGTVAADVGEKAEQERALRMLGRETSACPTPLAGMERVTAWNMFTR